MNTRDELESGLGGFALSAFFALFALLLVNLHGPNFEFDSSQYLVIADQFSNGNFDRPNEFAPLMPWMVGLLKLATGDMMLAINLYFLGVWLALFLTLRFAFGAGPLAMGFALAVLFTNAQTTFHLTHFMTELGYAILLVIAVAALGLAEAGPRRAGGFFARRREAIFLIALALLPMQRYIGGFLAVYLAAIYLIQAGSARDLQARLLKLTAAALPFIMVLYWNYLVTQSFGGFRDAAELGFFANVSLLWQIVAGHYRFETILYTAAAVLLVALHRRGADNRGRASGFAALLLLLVPAVQLAVQVMSSTHFYADEMNARYLVVVLPLVAGYAILAGARLSDAFTRRVPTFEPQLLREAGWAFAIAALLLARGWPGQFYFASLHDVSKRPELSKLLALPGMEHIAVAEGQAEERAVYASELLTGRLTYELACHRYTVKGSCHLSDFAFVPDCAGVSAPIFHPIVFETWDHIPAGTDGLLYRYSYQPHELAASMIDFMPSCALVTEPGDAAYSYHSYHPFYLFFDLRACSFTG